MTVATNEKVVVLRSLAEIYCSHQYICSDLREGRIELFGVWRGACLAVAGHTPSPCPCSSWLKVVRAITRANCVPTWC
jgi:hypothetical protein